jgi:RNA ligase
MDHAKPCTKLPMLETQTFLKTHSLAQLAEQFGIKSKYHHRFPNLVGLNYDQIESPKTHPIVQECRGLILDATNHWQIVSYPYRRFFNAGEDGADKIDWNSARCYDKCDGSLCILYFYANQWQVATRGTPDASGQVNQFGFSFADLFWQTWKELDYQMPQKTDLCYMFELMTPFNRIIVQHTKNQLLLHGARNLRSLQELDPIAIASTHNWQAVSTYPMQTLDQILKAAAALEPMQAEGYIICDRTFNRVKVKSPAYVAVAHLKSGLSNRRLLEILLANESEEFLLHFPEWTQPYEQIKDKLNRLTLEMEEIYQTYQHLESQKDFAIAIKHHPLSNILFQRRAHKISSIAEGMRQLQVQRLEQMLELEDLSLTH